MSEFDKKISALTSGSLSAATDEYVIARGGGNLKISGADVAAAATKVGTLAELAVTGAVTLGADVVVSRGAANRLDLASGDSLNLVSGSLKIAGTDVLSATTLGSGVTASSLTSVGTLTALTVTGDLTVDTSTLKVDAANNRVGIGTASPAARLDVQGTGDTGVNIQTNTSGNPSLALSAAGADGCTIRFSRSALALQFGISAIPTAMTLDASGNLLTGGKTTATANGGDVQVSSGITFPATPVAKSDVNTLDAYEEGTWTPVVSDGTNNATMDADNGGRYVKIGKAVTIVAQVGVATIGSVGANARITGLPFATTAETPSRAAVAVGYGASLNITAGHAVTGYIELGTQRIELMVWDATSGTTGMSGTEISDGGTLFISATYVASS